MAEMKQTLDLREIRRMLWRRKFLIVLPALVTLLGAMAGVTTMEPKYDAMATLGVENPMPMTRTLAQATGTMGRRHRDEGIRLVRKRIMSSDFLGTLAIQIGLTQNERLIERTQKLHRENPEHEFNDLLMRQCVWKLRKMLDIRAEGYDVFHIRAISSTPDLAVEVATTVADQYIQTTRQKRMRQSETALSAAEEQAAIYERKYEEARRRVNEYKQEMAVRPLSSSPLSNQNVSQVHTLISSAEADEEFLRGKHNSVRRSIRDAGGMLDAYLDMNVLNSSLRSALESTVLELERHLAMTLVESETGDGSQVTGARNRVALKSQELLTELEQLANENLPSIPAEYRRYLVDFEYTRIRLAGTERRKEELLSFLDKYATQLKSLPAEEFRLKRLEEDAESARRLFETWSEQAKSTQISKAVQSGKIGDQIILIEEAKLPLAPFAPQKRKIIGLALLMGLALGIGAAVMMEYFDSTLKSVEDIEALLGAPILGAVPRMQSAVLEDIEDRKRRRTRVLVPSLVFTALTLVALGYYYFFIQSGGAG